MKTMTNGIEVRRVSNEDAPALSQKGWSYCPKKVWKRKVRDHKEVKHG